MFPGMFMRKPDKAAALKQLKTHVAMFGAWVAVVRVTPYILHYFAGETDELKLEF
ncbi:mitochondrial import receptor subunit TOM6 homolog [Mangifera indica]|uniref:mitochondrial import receptor subunit TOM6 homolog n=1 Tax=Mangifera indica TaxID=29780 RepID=UPI001CFB98B3|nr:mitochondrial import receptor subunit TOM6 homolog [Mangifera indica]